MWATPNNNGTVSGTPASGFTYTPRAGFDGTDSIEYLVVDPDGHVGLGSISVRVLAAGDTDQPPVARRDVERANKGQAITISALGNDSDPEGGGLTIVSVLTPAHGTVSNRARTSPTPRTHRSRGPRRSPT